MITNTQVFFACLLAALVVGVPSGIGMPVDSQASSMIYSGCDSDDCGSEKISGVVCTTKAACRRNLMVLGPEDGDSVEGLDTMACTVTCGSYTKNASCE